MNPKKMKKKMTWHNNFIVHRFIFMRHSSMVLYHVYIVTDHTRFFLTMSTIIQNKLCLMFDDTQDWSHICIFIF